MAVSSLKPTSGDNEFNLSITGVNTSAILSKEYAAGIYTIVSEETDAAMDIYAFNIDGSLAGYTATKTLNATKGFTKVTVLGGTQGDVLTFTYKAIFATTTETNQTAAGAFLTSSDPSILGTVDDEVTVIGGNFAENLDVFFVGQNGVDLPAKSVTRVSSTELRATRPDVFLEEHSPYSIKVVNSGVPQPSATNSNILSNAVATGAQAPVWVTGTSLPIITKDLAYSTTVVATDPEGADVDYTIVSGSLPAGITLNSETGVISGTTSAITVDGASYTVGIRAADSLGNFVDRTFTAYANIGPAWVTPAGELTATNYGVSYSYQLEATAGEMGGVTTFSIVSGSLPSGLSLSESGSTAGLISGTPTMQAGASASFTVRAQDEQGKYYDRSFIIYGDSAGEAVITSSGWWQVPEGVSKISVVAVGGGGGGSTSTTATGGFSGGGGGGGGLHWRNEIPVSPGEYLAVNVGAAGLGGTAVGTNNATAGGTSSVTRGPNLLVEATGGEAGKYNLGNTALGGTPNLALGGGGGNGGRGGGGVDGQGIIPSWTQNGSTAQATFQYTGSAKTLTIPAYTQVTFDVVGAQGGRSGGYGGRVTGNINSQSTARTVYLYVGGAGSQGSGAAGGWNGGGTAGSGRGDEGSGGGASDIRLTTSANDRIVVGAGGGGSGGFSGGQGGNGGGTSGSAGTSGQGQGGSGATSSSGGNGGYPNGGTWGANGDFGVGGTGGSSSTSGGGGGGAGWYGGGGGGADVDSCCSNAGGGGGGSSYAHPSHTNAITHTGAYRQGNGYISLSYTGTVPDESDSMPGGGGGGAGGYSGNGGDGSLNSTFGATAGQGGAGSGANGNNVPGQSTTIGGGGVGIFGEGTSGAAPTSIAGQAGNAGSGGSGKTYGAGGNGVDDDSSGAASNGGPGVVRIIWGSNRLFPSTNVGVTQ